MGRGTTAGDGVHVLGELKAILAADLGEQDDPARLADFLYDHCYTVSFLDPPPPSAQDGADDDLTPTLTTANQGRPSWDEGWRIDQVLGEGRILGRKGGSARAFLPGDYLTHRGLGSGPEAGGAVSILSPPGSPDLQPGFYYAFGETVSEFAEDEGLLRFYWNISAEGAPRLVEAVTHDFNRFQVPFRLKCVNRRSDYPRRDAAVLYLHRRYYPIAALLVEPIHAGLERSLDAGRPLFTKRLAGGLGLAEDPGESFGKHRSRVLAEAVVASRGKPLAERLEEVRRRFSLRGLSLDQPWLNAGSIDRYEFPFPVS